MSTFEYAMVLISIIIGLGITHILSSLGSAVHRLQHHGRSLRIEINYLVWVAFIFTWLVQFWWWRFRWSELVPALDVGIFNFVGALLGGVVHDVRHPGSASIGNH